MTRDNVKYKILVSSKVVLNIVVVKIIWKFIENIQLGNK